MQHAGTGRRAVLAALVSAASAAGAFADLTADFEDLVLAPDSYWNGSPVSPGAFTSRGVQFRNDYQDYGTYDTWNGFAYSNVLDTNTAGYLNQYAVISGTGRGGGGIYAVGYDDDFSPGVDARITLADPAAVRGLYVNNTTYTALALRDGNDGGFGGVKAFGGPGGDDPDTYKLSIAGYDAGGGPLGTVDFYLADYRFADPAQDYVVTDWTFVDLSGLGPDVKRLDFTLETTDVGTWGANTPKYFALDDLVVVPEPAAAGLVAVGALLAAFDAAGRARRRAPAPAALPPCALPYRSGVRPG